MLTLYVDGDRWRTHLRAVADAHPGIVPVMKGNGYGFGVPRLARRAAWLGVDTVAVGTYEELPQVASRYDGSLLVLTPWRPFDSAVTYGPRIVHTVGRLEDLERLVARDDRPRVVLERLTSMRRHGFSASDLRTAAELARSSGRVVLEGAALHLPMTSGSHLPEVERLLTDIVAAGLARSPGVVYTSHLSEAEMGSLRSAYPDLTFRPRVGTGLWLGAPDALAVRATVLDVHPVERGDVFGYRGRSAPRRGWILVVSGGTAHGVGLEAPTSGSSLRARAVRLAQGGLDAAGLVRSPFTVDGRLRLFGEPPHMQVSLVFLPHGATVPAVGDELDVRVRHTIATFDRTLVS